MPRRSRLDAPGTLHHVMVRGIERRRIVEEFFQSNRTKPSIVQPKRAELLTTAPPHNSTC
jgi:hypothetical protein